MFRKLQESLLSSLPLCLNKDVSNAQSTENQFNSQSADAIVRHALAYINLYQLSIDQLQAKLPIDQLQATAANCLLVNGPGLSWAILFSFVSWPFLVFAGFCQNKKNVLACSTLSQECLLSW